jgi:hypothetical protein
MGMGGAIFDWLRMLYERMEYYVRHGDQNSAEIKAFIGLLTGPGVLSSMESFHGRSYLARRP